MVGVFTGLGVLTKSVLGVFPLAVVALYTLWCGRARRARRTGVWLAPLAPEKKLWHVMSAFPARALAAWVKSHAARARVTLGGFALIAATGAVLALTPFGSPPARQPDLQTVAPAARTLVPEQGRSVLVGGGYYSVAHQFIFYSDRALVLGPDDAAQVRAALDAGDWALVPRDGYAGLVAADSLRYPVALSSGRWMLVHAAPLPRGTLAPTNPFK